MFISGHSAQNFLTAVFKIGGLYYKSFTIVIYDRNDSTIIEPLL
jgi:hypothetical protein